MTWKHQSIFMAYVVDVSHFSIRYGIFSNMVWSISYTSFVQCAWWQLYLFMGCSVHCPWCCHHCVSSHRCCTNDLTDSENELLLAYLLLTDAICLLTFSISGGKSMGIMTLSTHFALDYF